MRPGPDGPGGRVEQGQIRWDYAGYGMERAGASARERRNCEGRVPMAGEELIGMMFTTAKELRHLAEQQFAELFVPVETIAEGRNTAIFALRLPDGRMTVRAERAAAHTPYRITRVEPEAEGRRIA